MRKKLICCFIALVLTPVMILYFASYKIFDTNKRDYLQMLSTKNIATMERTLDDYFSSPLDLSLYPFMETNLIAFLKASGTESNYFRIYQNAYSILNMTPYSNDGVLSVSLCSTSHNDIQVGFQQDYLSEQDMALADKANGTPVWGETTASYQSVLLTVSRLIRDTLDTSQKLGYIKVIVSTNEIHHLLNVSNDIPGICYYVVDADGRDIASSDTAKQYTGLKTYFRQDVPKGEAAETIPATVNGNLFYISSVNISKTPYVLYSITPYDSVIDIQGALVKGVGLTAAMLVLFGVFLAVFLSKWLVRPLRTLSAMTETVAVGDFSRRISVSGNDEIAGLTRQFNRMTEKLEHLYNEVYASKLKQQQAELSALLAKIDPHFLHNTLDAIYWTAESGDMKRVSKMVSALSAMMRYNISDDSCGEMTPLHQETDCLKSYLYIQHVRYGDSIQFLITIEPGLENCMVLKFILQPLVENAIVHGVAPVGSGIVNVLVYRDKNELIYEIRNTGRLADTETLQKALTAPPKGKKGFALKNISDRLRLKFGEKGSIQAESDGVQTIFKVRQPFLPGSSAGEDRNTE
ncbi:MAG: sensor histidine kinase [Clostridiales bacterium]|nr:sensor histidine kinase [Clostridiales bacterium]